MMNTINYTYLKELFFYVLVLANVVSAAMFIYDKEASKWNSWRIRNWILILSAFIGAIGAYAIVILTNHKIKKFKSIFAKSKYIAGIQFLFIIGYYIT